MQINRFAVESLNFLISRSSHYILHFKRYKIFLWNCSFITKSQSNFFWAWNSRTDIVKNCAYSIGFNLNIIFLIIIIQGEDRDEETQLFNNKPIKVSPNGVFSYLLRMAEASRIKPCRSGQLCWINQILKRDWYYLLSCT